MGWPKAKVCLLSRMLAIERKSAAEVSEIRDVECVEHLAQDRQTVPFLERKALGEAEILGERRISELIIDRKDQRRDGAALGVLGASKWRVAARTIPETGSDFRSAC